MGSGFSWCRRSVAAPDRLFAKDILLLDSVGMPSASAWAALPWRLRPMVPPRFNVTTPWRRAICQIR